MKAKINIGDSSINFSLKSIRERYTDKSVFVSGMLSDYNGLIAGEKEEKAFKKALDAVWKEAFPKETLPVEETNEN
jgi:hypothetical protein